MARKTAIPEKFYPKIKEMYENDYTLSDIARKFSVTRPTMYKIFDRIGIERKNISGRTANKDLPKRDPDAPEVYKTEFNEKSLENLNPFKKGVEKRRAFLETLGKFGYNDSAVSTLLPADQAFKASEKDHFYDIVTLYLKDFENEDLNSSDVDDIIGIAVSKIIELRLLQSSKGNDLDYTNVVNAIDKIHKRSDKLKESLSARRSDRIDIRKKGNVSIVDLAAMFDEDEEDKLQKRIRELEEKNEEAVGELKKFVHEDA